MYWGIFAVVTLSRGMDLPAVLEKLILHSWAFSGRRRAHHGARRRLLHRRLRHGLLRAPLAPRLPVVLHRARFGDSPEDV